LIDTGSDEAFVKVRFWPVVFREKYVFDVASKRLAYLCSIWVPIATPLPVACDNCQRM